MRWVPGNIGLIVAQLALAVLALLAVAFTPPAEGRMLLVPLDGQPVSRADAEGLRATALTSGPLPGSLVVEGNRDLLSALWARRVLVLAAPAALCVSE
ncbi:MAG TPA: hypothetical protein VGD23_11740 [Sphingomicrobium sp.]